MSKPFKTLLFLLPLTAAPVQAMPVQASAPLSDQLKRCRTLTDTATRLACYDAMAVLPGRSRDPAPRRVLNEDKESPLTTTLRTASVGGDGRWIFTLAQGGRWLQTDDAPLGRRPNPGDAVEVRAGALGSYRLKVKTGPSIKVRPLD